MGCMSRMSLREVSRSQSRTCSAASVLVPVPSLAERWAVWPGSLLHWVQHQVLLGSAHLLCWVWSLEGRKGGKETGAQPCQLSCSTCLQLINPARLEPAFHGPEGPALHSWLQGSRAGIPTLASWGLGLDPGGFITSSSTPRCCSQSQILYSMGPSLALYQRFELFLALMNQLQIIRRHHHYVGID